MVPVSAGQFSVGSAAVSVTVSRVTTTDITPPSRITDLTVTSVHDTTVNLTWAAPGGDLDQGSGESSARKCGCLISMQVLLEKLMTSFADALVGEELEFSFPFEMVRR